MSVPQSNREGTSITRSKVDTKLRATPIARLKRRILQKRRCVSPPRTLETDGDVRKSQSPSKSQTEITQLLLRPITSSKERPGTPKLDSVSNKSSSTLTNSFLRKQNTEDKPTVRAKTPPARQRPKPQSYLERWKAAQLNPRPCTALGLLSQLESDSAEKQVKGTEGPTHKVDFPQVVNRHSRQISPVRVTLEATTGRNAFSSTHQPEQRNDSALILTRTFPSKPRPVTSLGILTLRENNINPAKSVQFQIEESATRSHSRSTLLQHRPKTPAAFVDGTPAPLTIREKTPREEQQSALSSKSQTSLNMFDIVQNGTTHDQNGVVKPAFFSKTGLSSEKDNTQQQGLPPKLSQPRRFVIARSKDVKARALSREANSSPTGRVTQMARDLPNQDPSDGRPDKMSLFRKKVVNICPRAIKLPRSVTPQPRQTSEMSRNDLLTSKTGQDSLTVETVRRHTPFLRKGKQIVNAANFTSGTYQTNELFSNQGINSTFVNARQFV